MNPLRRAVSHCLVALAGAVGLWLAFIAFASQSALAMPPAVMVMLMTAYIIAYAVVAFLVHWRSVAGVPFEDDNDRRRPSMVIPTVSTIALMVFVVSYAASNPAIWTLA